MSFLFLDSQAAVQAARYQATARQLAITTTQPRQEQVALSKSAQFEHPNDWTMKTFHGLQKDGTYGATCLDGRPDTDNIDISRTADHLLTKLRTYDNTQNATLADVPNYARFLMGKECEELGSNVALQASKNQNIPQSLDKNLPSPSKITLESYERNLRPAGYILTCSSEERTLYPFVDDDTVLSDYNNFYNTGTATTSVSDIDGDTLWDILDQNCRSIMRGSMTADAKQAQLPTEAPASLLIASSNKTPLLAQANVSGVWFYDAMNTYPTVHEELGNGLQVACEMEQLVPATENSDAYWEHHTASFFAPDEEIKDVLRDAINAGNVENPQSDVNRHFDERCRLFGEPQGATPSMLSTSLATAYADFSNMASR